MKRISQPKNDNSGSQGRNDSLLGNPPINMNGRTPLRCNGSQGSIINNTLPHNLTKSHERYRPNPQRKQYLNNLNSQ